MNHPAVVNCNYFSWNWNRTSCSYMNYNTKKRDICCGRTKNTLCPWRNKDHDKISVRQATDATV